LRVTRRVGSVALQDDSRALLLFDNNWRCANDFLMKRAWVFASVFIRGCPFLNGAEAKRKIETADVGVDGPTASRARIGAVNNQDRSRP
jgi:hypothetical protein